MTTPQFVSRSLIVIALATVAALAWALSNVLLLAFGSILLAIILHAIADQIRAWTGLGKGWALLAAGLLGLAVVGGTGYLFGQRISTQLGYLVQQLPSALRIASGRLGIEDPMHLLQSSSVGAIVTRIFSWGSTILDTATGILFMVVAGIYMAVSPDPYHEGFIRLFPPRWHTPLRETLDDAGEALRLWFSGQLIAMLIVGTMTAIGMWLIGLPSALALGLIAGVTEFVPYVGPIMGAIPALLLASSQGPEMVLWALAVVLIVQQSENQLIVPLIMRRTVAVAPAVGTFAVLAFGTLFGWLGVLLGYPLAVVADVAIRRLYVRGQLGEEVDIAGEDALRQRVAAERAEGAESSTR